MFIERNTDTVTYRLWRQNRVPCTPSDRAGACQSWAPDILKKVKMKKILHCYTVSFQHEPFRQGTRHYWLICRDQQPNEMVSWGYAPTVEMAQEAARKELEDLSSGESQGGQASCSVKPSTNWISRKRY
jgi:hypothetical protein